MAESHTPRSLTDNEVTVHTAPLPGEAKVLVFVQANSHVTHVLSLGTHTVRQLVVGLLDALDVATLNEGDSEPTSGD